LRLSVTDRCNLRCAYCMPEEEYLWLPREDILTFEEMARLVSVFGGCGVDRIRVTGGEPLLRRDLAGLIRLLAQQSAASAGGAETPAPASPDEGVRSRTVRDLALTTNGILLADQAAQLRDAGLHRITVSLDTLRPDRFTALTRSTAHGAVLEGIDAARAAFGTLKIDTVVIRGTNDDELEDLLEFGKRVGAEIRFIEYMDVGGATRWTLDQVVSRQEMLATLERRYGTIEPIVEETSAAADRFVLRDGTVFGIISSTTAPFCRQCDRSRVTADGMWYLCLYATRGIDLRAPLRAGASDAHMQTLIESGWRPRADRGAEQRLEADRSGPFIPIGTLRRDAHLEMHTRGG
jgi:cyclic pyranopterin phosphate synthase